jgi:hypothetical protein
MSNGFSKTLGAGLLTFAVIGGSALFLGNSLNSTPVRDADTTTAVHSTATTQPIEVVTVTATRRAS